ncbi:MAG TPA: TetR/AcrR family transcriptional regulator [Acidimicrobiia bacterium]
MLGTSIRQQRQRDARDLILAAAWDVVREEGLGGLTMRDLAARVGMRAPSLYSYFASKNDIYDAMFRQGYEQMEASMRPFLDLDELDRETFRAASRVFFDFCTEDPDRYQLLFQRTLPGFEPSPESFSLAEALMAKLQAALTELGATEPSDVDMWTAISSGLTSQQIANDPGGDRWSRLLDEAIDMFFAHIDRRLERERKR